MLITVHDIIEKCKFYTENENVDFATKEDEDGIMIKFFDNDNHVAATYITKDYMYENYMYDYMSDRIDRLILFCLEKLEKKD